ncbi:MAG: phenylalanine--tRNA ligase subunit beta, partial [Saprospiraceae bacterium]|nr:phenylalanine--tRNA ligase subunit beta [Saprospiraceae bacterium]
MKVSLNWLKDYLHIDLPPEKVGQILTDIGLEVEGEEVVESVKGGMEGMVIGYVVKCWKHPNADRLSLTKVDTGTGEELQIVCGAPNVAAGQKVVVATVGTTIYPPDGEPWTVRKGKIRGEVSEGMICSEDEMGIGTDHSGIVVLPDQVEVGTHASEYYEIEKDYVYDIGLTPNRSDATNHIGVAMDLAAALQINYDHSGEVDLPDIGDFEIDSRDLPVEVEVENTEACPRYSGISIKGIRIGESPDWLKKRLRAIGVRPKSNIVDITNFVLHELGQPLHAFDLDRIKGQKVIVKTLAEGSTFVSLDEVVRELSDEDLMICDGKSKGMCIGGVFGGAESGVTEDTVNIFLESAHFHPKWIRRSSMRHNLRTDAARVFEKGSDPNITVYALKRAAMLIKELAGGEIASDIVDIYPEPIEPVEVEVRYRHVNRLIGAELSPEEIRAILEALRMEVVSEEEETFTVAVPTNKADVTREADLIEEILRIYGFNKVDIPDQFSTSVSLGKRPDPGKVRDVAGDLLAAHGFHEMMAVSLSQSRYYEQILESVFDKSELVYINNTSNAHLDIMRPDMLFSGLEAIVHNQNRQQTDLKLFEFGKTYRKSGGKYREEAHLSLFMTGLRWKESWILPEDREANYYSLKGFAGSLLQRLGIEGFQASPLKDDVFAWGMRYHRGPQDLVRFGRIQKQISEQMDIRGEVYFADFQWDNLLR